MKPSRIEPPLGERLLREAIRKMDFPDFYTADQMRSDAWIAKGFLTKLLSEVQRLQMVEMNRNADAQLAADAQKVFEAAKQAVADGCLHWKQHTTDGALVCSICGQTLIP